MRLRYFFSALIFVLTICSCSQNQKKGENTEGEKIVSVSFEEQTKQNLIAYMKATLKEPESATLDNFEVLISNDSLCLYNFDCKAKNSFGAMGKERYTYSNFKINGRTWQYFSKAAFAKTDLKWWLEEIRVKVLLETGVLTKAKYLEYKKMNERDCLSSLMYESLKNESSKTEVSSLKKKNDAIKL